MMKFIRVSLISLILVHYLVQHCNSRSLSDEANLRFKKLKGNSLICKSDYGEKSKNLVQVRILAQTRYGMTQVFGRIVKIKKPGTFLILCYLAFPSQKNTIWIKEMYKFSYDKKLKKYERNATDFSQKSFELMNDRLFSSLRVKVKHSIRDPKRGIHLVSCSNAFPFNHQEDLHLFRIRPDGSRKKVPMNARRLSASISTHGDFIILKYKHKFFYSHKYYQNTFECRTQERFSHAYKTTVTKPITDESKCEGNLQIKNTVESIWNETFDPESTIWKCSCPGAHPKPNIFWIDSVGNRIKGSTFNLFKSMDLSKFHCCAATQTFESGKRHNKRICKLDKKNLSCQNLKVLYPSLKNGVYKIKVNGKSMRVYCEMESPPHGWIVVQRRLNGSEDFARYWMSYRNGFGDLKEEFWLGNENLFQLSSNRTGSSMKIRFDLWDKDDKHAYAEYSQFSVSGESDNYRLSISGYSGTAGDSMSYSNSMQFSTKDKDNDKSPGSCSRSYGSGGWWYAGCTDSNLNANYVKTFTSSAISSFWNHFKPNCESLKKIIIKIAYN